MFKHHLKAGWRNFIKYKSYSIINLFGLAVGFAAALLLFLIVRYENSFDRFHTKLDRIYRVGNSYTTGGFDEMIVTPQIPAMEREYPDIVHATRFFDSQDIVAHDNEYTRISYHIVDSGFSEMFDFSMISGDLKQALSSANQIVLTRSAAIKLFGSTDAMGKTVSFVNQKTDFTVAAIAEDPPKNSTLQFEALIPWENAPDDLDIDQSGNWYNTFMVGYVLVSPGTSKEELEEKLIAFKNKHFLEERRATWDVLLMPLSQEHFRITKNKQMITILGIIAGAILLISCFNYTNMSVAQTLKRSREIGLRRVLGSLRQQLTFQFMTESLITCILSILIGIGITLLALPYINDYYDFGIAINLRQNQSLVLFLLSICVATCFFSTIGPSLALSGLKPVVAMRGAIKGNKSAEYVRRGLVIFQFTASAVLIIGTVVVLQQTHYMKSQDLKLDHSNVIAVDTWPDLFQDPEKARQGFHALREEVKNVTAIKSATFTSGIPGEYNENYNTFILADSAESKRVSLRKLYVDENFFKTFEMKTVKGRGFSPEIESDKQAVIVNETALKEFGVTNLANMDLMENGAGKGRLHVIGVVEDYYYQSLQRSIQPLVHFYEPRSVNHLAVRLESGRIQDGLSLLREKWNALGPYESFDYRFVDKSFDTLYKEQDRLSATALLFSMIAVTIAGLGLFSVAAYSVRIRRKEVSIRKVLGASVLSIMVKLSKGYGIMILVGFLLACPIVYHLANTFLDGFAYRIELSPLLFGAIGLAIFILSMLVVGVLSGRVALENPVNALKED